MENSFLVLFLFELPIVKGESIEISSQTLEDYPIGFLVALP